ncbi:MAG: MMPL family transporter, partial [Clostridia bacterium]
LEAAVREIPHVDAVIGYASATKGLIPVEIIPENIRQMFSRGDCMLSAVFFDEGSSSEETMEAIQQVRKVAGEKCFVSGLSAVVTDTKHLVEDQEAIYVGIAVALCAVVLMITMDSFLLPLIFLACIGVSVLWNMGTNYFMGEISYITKAVAAVLQLGVTLDYSIFLWHSYKEQKALTEDKDEAMVAAIHQTFTSILGSSLTTIAGFVSICFMSFTLGKDLGIVMSKGVVLGLLNTVVLLPCVIRVLDTAIEKTSHKPILPNVGGIGRFVVKHYKALCVILALMIFPAFYGYGNVKVYYDMSKVMPQDLQSVIANKKLEETFDMSTTHLLLVDSDVSQKDVRKMTDEMKQVDGVTDVFGLDSFLGADIPESILPPETLSLVRSDRYQLMLINSSYVISSDEVNRQIDTLNGILKKYDAGGMLIGEAPCTKDLIACTDRDFTVVSLISIIAIFVIILLVQKSLSLPVLLVAVIELAIAANLCIPYFTGTELPFVGPILISTIQLGATVDYAILMTTRYKQNRLSGMGKKEAVEKAVSSAAQSILVSGLGFFAATYGVGLYSNVDIISSMCRLIARGALLSVAVVLLLLPAVLLLLDKLIVHTTLDLRKCADQ